MPRSYQVTPDIPDRRRATQRKVVRPNGRQPERESARRRSGTISTASDITDTTDHNSKPEGSGDLIHPAPIVAIGPPLATRHASGVQSP
jgi:hypothetical protein